MTNYIEIYLKKYGISITRNFTEISFEYEMELFKGILSIEEIKKKSDMNALRLFQNRFSAFQIEDWHKFIKTDDHEREIFYELITGMIFFKYNFEEEKFEYTMKNIRPKDFFYQCVERIPEWKKEFKEENKLKIMFGDEKVKQAVYREEAIETMKKIVKKTEFEKIFTAEFAKIIKQELIS